MKTGNPVANHDAGPAARGRRADGAATRLRIIEAAGALIGEQGFAQVTGRAIAGRAGVDVASINYHFGSRERLYQELLVEAHGRLIAVPELAAVIHAALPAQERLRRLIALVVARAMGRNGWIAQVLAREVMGPSSHFVVLRPLIAQKFGIAVSLFAELSGCAPEDPRVVLNAIAIAAPFAAIVLLRRSFGDELTPLTQLPADDLVAHLTRFVVGGLGGVAPSA